MNRLQTVFDQTYTGKNQTYNGTGKKVLQNARI